MMVLCCYRLLGCVQVMRHRGSGALRDAIAKVIKHTIAYKKNKCSVIAQIQKERMAFGVQDKKPCIIEISEKGFSLHDNTDNMEVSMVLVVLLEYCSCAH